MDLTSISLRSIKSLGDLIGPKTSKEEQLATLKKSMPNSLGDLVSGSNYHPQVLLHRLNQIKQILASDNPGQDTVMEYLVKNKQLDELERFIDEGLIDFKSTEIRTNPLADFISDIVSNYKDAPIDPKSAEKISRIVNKITNVTNANTLGIQEKTPLACLIWLHDETLAIQLSEILIEKGSIDLSTDKTGDRGMPYVMQVLINDGDPNLKLELAEHLIAKGASITDTDSDGNNVLHLLSEHYSTDTQISVAQFALEHGIKANATNSSGLNSVEVALEQRLDQRVIKTLDPDGKLSAKTYTSLFNLLDQKDYEGIKVRLRISTEDIDNLNLDKKTLLYAVIDACSSRDDEASQAASLDMVRFLLAQGAKSNLNLTEGGYVYKALSKNREDIAYTLLDKGASPDLLYSNSTGERDSIAIEASLGTLNASSKLINKIHQTSRFTPAELVTLKEVLDVLITKNNRRDKKSEASETSRGILANLDIGKREGECISPSDLTRAFNQIMLSPIFYQNYTNFYSLAMNYDGSEVRKKSALRLLKLGHDHVAGIISLQDRVYQGGTALSSVKSYTYFNRAMLAYNHNKLSGQETFNPATIASDFREAKTTAEASKDYELAREITEFMEKHEIPTFE